MDNRIYGIREVSNFITIVDEGSVPGKSRASGFLKSLSNALKNNIPITNLDVAQSAVEQIQARVENRFFYKVLSYIPFTEANTVSKLISDVKNKLLKTKLQNAEKNISDPYNFFKMSPQLKEFFLLCKKDPDSLFFRPLYKNIYNRTKNELLFGFSLKDNKLLKSFRDSSSDNLLVFVNVDQENNLVKIFAIDSSVGPSPTQDQEILYIKEVFQCLRDYK